MSNYRKTDDKQSPSPPPLKRGGSFPQESICLLLNWIKSPLHVFIYIQKATPKGDNEIHAGINTLESDRHVIIEIIACIVGASIGNSNLFPVDARLIKA